WVQYALDAPVMMIRTDEGSDNRGHGTAACRALGTRLTFAEWIDSGHPLGWPTIEDLDYHLTTLFPPVRPRGWLELRVIDALPDEWWPVAVAVAATLMDDAHTAAAASIATTRTRDAWIAAAQHGLSDPALRDAADGCFRAVLDALPRLGTDADTVDAVAAYHD